MYVITIITISSSSSFQQTVYSFHSYSLPINWWHGTKSVLRDWQPVKWLKNSQLFVESEDSLPCPQEPAYGPHSFFLNWYSGGGVQLGPLGTTATNRHIVSAPGEYDDGEIGGMMIGRETRSTRRRPPPVPLCPTQTPHACPDTNLIALQSSFQQRRKIRHWTLFCFLFVSHVSHTC
jgi:hypothetical protein